MENTMRRRSILKFKKYIFIFFVILIAVIWVNHYSQDKSSNKVAVKDTSSVDHNTHEDVKPTPRTESPRERRVRLLHERLMRPDEDEDTTTEETPSNYAEEQVDYFGSLSDIQRSRLRKEPVSRFFVKNSQCKMPYADPFSKEAVALLQPVKLMNCSDESSIFSLKFDQNLLRYRLQVDTTMIEKLKPNVAKLSCSYRKVAIDTISPWKTFQDEVVIDWIASGIVAECHNALRAKETIQEDAFPMVQVPYRGVYVVSDPLKRKPSVLMLGLDSISRMNFKRSMPKTAEFVKQDGWFEMEGYSKVEDSAFSNLCAVLGGAKSDEACEKRFPMLWQAYKEAGYTTAFGQDTLEFPLPSEFRPDYQLRSLLEDIGQSMSTVNGNGFEYCTGRRQSFSYLYDFCMQFAQRLIEELDQPAFGVFWSSTFTRDYVHGPASLDDRLVQYLNLMREHHVFERAIVILFSDQGQKSGDLVELKDGFLEERLPMLHIYLPPWFRKAYPEFASNLHDNRNRLTSAFDLHNTLRHILNLKASIPKELPSLMNCRNSQSLFHLVPFNRSCAEACIRLHWCACNEFALVPNNIEAYHCAKTFVSHINFWMLKNHFNLHCQRLRLTQLEYTERSLDKMDKSTGGSLIFRMRVRTYPEDAVYESTVRFTPDLTKMIDVNMRDVSSFNHHNRTDCVKDSTAKKFCSCYPDLKDEEMEFWMKYKL